MRNGTCNYTNMIIIVAYILSLLTVSVQSYLLAGCIAMSWPELPVLRFCYYWY